MESEMLCYKQKVEQMTVLLRHYQNELESQKVRRDGVETVSRLLAESRQENVTLKKALINMETSTKNLKNRLVANGISAEADAGDTDVIVPGTSKQTLTNLAMENKRLRSMLQHDSTDSHSVNESDSLHKSSKGSETEHTLQQTVDKLQTENKSMKMKLSDMESLYKSSNNEKDRQLISLQAQVEQLQQQQRSGGEKTESTKPLAVLPALREQLRAFMSQCQALESSLEQAPESSEITTSKEAVERPGGDCVDGAEMKALQEEKQKLQDRVEEVTKMNQRWQEFFNERNRYTQGLEQRVQDLDERLKEAMRAGPTQEINRRIEQVLEKSQKEIGHMDELRQKAEDEVQALRQQVAERDAAMGQLQNQVTILSRSASASHHTATTAQAQRAAEANSTIEHLKYQIQVCTEDFEKERQDRQVALQKISTLQEQVTQLQKLNTHLQTLIQNQQTMQPAHHTPPARPPAQEHGLGETSPQNLQPRGTFYHHQAHTHDHDQLPRFDFEYDCPRSPPNNLNNSNSNGGGRDGSGGWRDYPDFDFEVPGPEHHHQHHLHQPMSFPGGSSTAELIARGTPPQQQPKLSLSDSALSAGTSSHPHSLADAKQNILTCPKCNREFSEEHQEELLAHMDECWE